MRDINSCLSEQRNDIELRKHWKTSPHTCSCVRSKLCQTEKLPQWSTHKVNIFLRPWRRYVMFLTNMLETLRSQKKKTPKPTKPRDNRQKALIMQVAVWDLLRESCILNTVLWSLGFFLKPLLFSVFSWLFFQGSLQLGCEQWSCANARLFWSVSVWLSVQLLVWNGSNSGDGS